MGLLAGKNALIFGLANDHSLAWGVAQALAAEEATLGVFHGPRSGVRRVTPLAEQVGAKLVMGCDVEDDAQIAAAAARAGEVFGQIDVLVHSIAYADREELQRPYVQTSRAGFTRALTVSCYSFTALTQALLPWLRAGASLMTMSAEASQRVVPGYNVMGLAKAALEASVRYLAYDLGPQGIRVNAISAGPIRTLAARGVPSFGKLYPGFAAAAPLRRNISIADVGGAAVWLASDYAKNVTGQVLQVDAGYSIMGVGGESEA